MLLFTWTGFVMKCGDLFQYSFRLLERIYHVININILFIVIGAIGAAGWLIKQHQLNSEAEQKRTFK